MKRHLSKTPFVSWCGVNYRDNERINRSTFATEVTCFDCLASAVLYYEQREHELKNELLFEQQKAINARGGS